MHSYTDKLDYQKFAFSKIVYSTFQKANIKGADKTA